MAERVLLKRIKDPKTDIGLVLGEVVGAAAPSEAVLSAVDERIVQSGGLVAGLSVLPYLIRFPRRSLFSFLDTLPGYCFGTTTLAQLFQVGYDSGSTEHKLCQLLEQGFEADGNPQRVAIVEALKVHGSRESLELLEEVRFTLEPKWKVQAVLAAGMEKLPSDALDRRFLEIVRGALDDFVCLVESAIAEIKQRVATDQQVQIKPNVAQASIAPQAEPAKAFQTSSLALAVIHKRQGKVAAYQKKAAGLLPDHPSSALTEMRKAAEAICKDLIDESQEHAKGAQGKRLDGLEDMRSELRQRKVPIPADADKYFDSVQSFSNLASHDQNLDPAQIDVDVRMAGAMLQILNALVDWYTTFRMDFAMKPDPSIR